MNYIGEIHAISIIIQQELLSRRFFALASHRRISSGDIELAITGNPF
jgi:hypothetical protein